MVAGGYVLSLLSAALLCSIIRPARDDDVSSRISSAMLVGESRTNSANGLPANALAMAEALPASATMAVVPALAYAQG